MLDNNSFPNNSASTGSNANPLDPLNQITNPNEILFIGSDISNYQHLIDGVNPNVQVYKLDSNHQLSDISNVLAGYSNLDAIHFVTHASDNNVQLGSQILDSSTLSNYTNDLTVWGNSLSQNGDILFYGCNLAANEGLDLIQGISNITGADVAASNDLTGASNLGGDWDFEANTGAIEAGVAFSSSTITGYDDSVFASLSGNLSGTNSYGNLIAAGPAKNPDDVTFSGDVTLTGDVTIDVVGDFTLGSGFTISGDGVGVRDNLTINSTDKVTIGGFIGGSGFQNLTINAPKIEILSTGIISTRVIDETVVTPNWETDASTNDSGTITFKSSANAKDFPDLLGIADIQSAVLINPEITVSGKLLSHVLDSDTETAGNIKITGEDIAQRLGGVTTIFGYSDKSVDIDLTSATLKGADVVVTGAAEDFNPFSQAPEWVQKAFIEPTTSASAYAINNFTIPISAQVRGSVANITVDGTNIDASGKVEITTSATVDSSVKAISIIGTQPTAAQRAISRFAGAYGQAKGDAQTLVTGNSSIDAGGNVTISSNTATTAKVLAQVYGNLSQQNIINSPGSQTAANADEKGFSLAIANTTTVSKALVDTNVAINSGGNVNVKADGTVKTEGKAQTSIFLDGSAGIGIGVNWDNTT
ncbi:MAG: DUF4347 domain-containing protein, partial [Sphaerospermopsis sp. SIO1G2]|nr:DUF4347 domain-containing protein [Sphaerospermopsis sp. SIO1G2]